MAARKAVVGKHTSPFKSGPRALEDHLHGRLERRGTAARESQEDGGAVPPLPEQRHDRHNEDRDDDQARAHGRQGIHDGVHPGRCQRVEEWRRPGVEREDLVLTDTVGDGTEEKDAGDQSHEPHQHGGGCGADRRPLDILFGCALVGIDAPEWASFGLESRLVLRLGLGHELPARERFGCAGGVSAHAPGLVNQA